MLSSSQQSLLRAIGEAGPLSRTQLADATGLSKAAVTGLARDLLGHGLLRPVDTVYGTGRPSTRLGIDPAGAYFLGCALLPGHSPVVLADLAGNVVAQAGMEAGPTPVAAAAALAAVLPGLLAGAGIKRGQVGGAGIAVSGLVGNAPDRPVRSALLGWDDVPVVPTFAAALGLPTTVENDANALALGEKLFGVARNARSFGLVVLGDGIGGALVIGGALFRGHRGGAGEIAHLAIEPGGAACPCGRLGCVDTVASLRAIAAAADAAGLPAELVALERHGGTRAAAILRRAGSALGLVIAHIVQVLDPGLVVLVHPPGTLDGVFGAAMREAAAEHVLPGTREHTALVPVPGSPATLARGAASIAAQIFLDPSGKDPA